MRSFVIGNVPNAKRWSEWHRTGIAPVSHRYRSGIAAVSDLRHRIISIVIYYVAGNRSQRVHIAKHFVIRESSSYSVARESLRFDRTFFIYI